MLEKAFAEADRIAAERVDDPNFTLDVEIETNIALDEMAEVYRLQAEELRSQGKMTAASIADELVDLLAEHKDVVTRTADCIYRLYAALNDEIA